MIYDVEEIYLGYSAILLNQREVTEVLPTAGTDKSFPALKSKDSIKLEKKLKIVEEILKTSLQS